MGFNDDRRLNDAHRLILNSEAPVFVSVASLWELAIKASLGKLRIDGDLMGMLAGARYTLLPIEVGHIDVLRGMPHHHRDPFDRMLVAQAIAEHLTLLSMDSLLTSYGVTVV